MGLSEFLREYASSPALSVDPSGGQLTDQVVFERVRQLTSTLSGSVRRLISFTLYLLLLLSPIRLFSTPSLRGSFLRHAGARRRFKRRGFAGTGKEGGVR